MKPADLKSPFHWRERRTLIEDHIWYAPEQLDENLLNKYPPFIFSGWAHPSMFTTNQPICIEYCSGNGAWIAAKAQAHPEKNWVAVERKFNRVRRIWSKIKNHQLSNLLIVCGEGEYVTQQYIPSASVQQVYINFPDPWPKTRHHKHRIVQIPFIQDIYRILQPGGTLTVATDDESFSHWTLAILLSQSAFEPVFSAPHYVEHYEGYGTSFFEDLWREQGKTIRYHVFRKADNDLLLL